MTRNPVLCADGYDEAYRALFNDAAPFARLEVAFLIQQGKIREVDSDNYERQIRHAYASTARLRGETVEQTAMRHLQPVPARKAA